MTSIITPVTALVVVTVQAIAGPETAKVQLLIGKINPRIVCASDPTQSYALYLPPGYSTNRPWPILYFFDPFARGQVAVEIVQPAAAKYGYIVAASNNSKNGPMGGSREAAIALWDDTHALFSVDPHRCYTTGISGGARVAVSVALSCGDCVAGVIADAAGFPPETTPPRPMKFALFGTLGDADPNYTEFVRLRRDLDKVDARYRIRIFEGSHGWAPPEVWMEALNWMDLQAMARGDLPRDTARIAAALQETLARAHAFEVTNDWLAAFREYQSAERDFSSLADVSNAKAKVVELEKNKAVRAAERQELSDIEEQQRIIRDPTKLLLRLAGGTLDTDGFSQLLSAVSALKKKATPPSPKNLVLRRALTELIVRCYDMGETYIQKKDFNTALAMYRLIVEGANSSGFAHYQRGRIYAMTSRKKEMLTELRLALSQGYHEPTAFDSDEFRAYREDVDFHALATDWKKAAK